MHSINLHKMTEGGDNCKAQYLTNRRHRPGNGGFGRMSRACRRRGRAASTAPWPPQVDARSASTRIINGWSISSSAEDPSVTAMMHRSARLAPHHAGGRQRNSRAGSASTIPEWGGCPHPSPPSRKPKVFSNSTSERRWSGFRAFPWRRLQPQPVRAAVLEDCAAARKQLVGRRPPCRSGPASQRRPHRADMNHLCPTAGNVFAGAHRGALGGTDIGAALLFGHTHADGEPDFCMAGRWLESIAAGETICGAQGLPDARRGHDRRDRPRWSWSAGRDGRIRGPRSQRTGWRGPGGQIAFSSRRPSQTDPCNPIASTGSAVSAQCQMGWKPPGRWGCLSRSIGFELRHGPVWRCGRDPCASAEATNLPHRLEIYAQRAAAMSAAMVLQQRSAAIGRCARKPAGFWFSATGPKAL